MTKRTLALVLVSVLCLGLLAGCGTGTPGAENTDTPSGDKGIELSVVTSYGGDDGNRGNY